MDQNLRDVIALAAGLIALLVRWITGFFRDKKLFPDLGALFVAFLSGIGLIAGPSLGVMVYRLNELSSSDKYYLYLGALGIFWLSGRQLVQGFRRGRRKMRKKGETQTQSE